MLRRREEDEQKEEKEGKEKRKRGEIEGGNFSQRPQREKERRWLRCETFQERTGGKGCQHLPQNPRLCPGVWNGYKEGAIPDLEVEHVR